MKLMILTFLFFLIFVEIWGKYEIIMERVDNLLGEEDLVIEKLNARVRKFNHTT